MNLGEAIIDYRREVLRISTESDDLLTMPKKR